MARSGCGGIGRTLSSVSAARGGRAMPRGPEATGRMLPKRLRGGNPAARGAAAAGAWVGAQPASAPSLRSRSCQRDTPAAPSCSTMPINVARTGAIPTKPRMLRSRLLMLCARK